MAQKTDIHAEERPPDIRRGSRGQMGQELDKEVRIDRERRQLHGVWIQVRH